MVSSPACSDSINTTNNIQCQDDDVAPLAIVIMGVSGSGKSDNLLDHNAFEKMFPCGQTEMFLSEVTVGDMLAKTMGCSFIDADDFHPNANKYKMSKGIPLSDEDRIPWLERLSDLLRENIVNCNTVILGCSALQKKYREILRVADPSYKSGSYVGCRVRFVCLEVPVEVIAARLEKRAEEGNHFMPAKLLQSQLDLLQIDDAEGILMVDATLNPQAIVNNVRDLLFH